MTPQPTTYHVVARYAHWTNALLLIVAWGLHDLMADNPTLLWLHIVLGTLALITSVLQLLWYAFTAAPPKLPNMDEWRTAATRWNHRLIMLFALLAIGTGLGLTLSSGLGLLPTVADLSNLNDSAFGATIFHEPHEILSMGLMLLFLMHLAGVVSYQLMKGNTLARMAPRIFGRNP